LRNSVVPRTGGGTALTAPITTVLPAVEQEEEKFLKIFDHANRRVVTVIELVSPSNKEGAGRDAYLTKRAEYVASGVNLVEIDLLRGGLPLPSGEPPPPASDFHIMVCRWWDRRRAGYWPIALRDRLPLVPVPLSENEPEVMLDLKACIDEAYDAGRYNVVLPYDRPLGAPWNADESAWAAGVVAGR